MVARRGGAMTLQPFPPTSTVSWRRIDVPGREEAQVEQVPRGWNLSGTLEVEEAGTHASLSYRVELDHAWRTRSAVVQGQAGGTPFRMRLEADARGNWSRDGVPLRHLHGALDVGPGIHAGHEHAAHPAARRSRRGAFATGPWWMGGLSWPGSRSTTLAGWSPTRDSGRWLTMQPGEAGQRVQPA